jgi:transcriptional regulator with GAF, ATPase, and Fis domain
MARRPRKPGEDPDPIAELLALKPRPAARVPETTASPVVAETEFRRYRDLLDVAISLTSSLELRAILDAIVDGVIRVTGCERGFVILPEKDGTYAMYTGRSREGTPWDESRAREISHSVVNKVTQTHEPFLGLDLSEIEGLREQKSIVVEKIRSAVCLPLVDQDQLIGVIYADSTRPIASFSETDRAVMSAFCAQAAVAIARARQHGETLDRGERLEEQNRQLREQLGQHVNMSGMISRNKRMLDVFAVVERIAPSDISSVLVQGESGTGKELLSRAIHEKSPRHGGPYVAVNCTALPASLAESILFGHRKGAFTGADADRAGLFEIAHRGTLFLDEIGDMPLEVQPKILRALQEKEVTRLGEDGSSRKVDVHIVAATNRDLPREVEEGRFRSDLFFRLRVAHLHIPPLRERREDILPLAEYFLQQHAERRNQTVARLSREARAFLLAHSWPGNVRELQNAMEWGCAFQDENNVINVDALDRFFQPTSVGAAPAVPDTGSLREKMEQFEARIVRDALGRNDNNVSATAKALGLSRQMLHEKIKKYGIVTRET